MSEETQVRILPRAQKTENPPARDWSRFRVSSSTAGGVHQVSRVVSTSCSSEFASATTTMTGF